MFCGEFSGLLIMELLCLQLQRPKRSVEGIDDEFINKEYIFIGTRSFGQTKNKDMRAYAQSGQYHTIVKIRDS